ncbi:MAG: hypothetical protein ACPGU1_22190, partial [Myxococcota bacterium]
MSRVPDFYGAMMGAYVMRNLATLVTATLLIVACSAEDPTQIPDSSALQSVGAEEGDAAQPPVVVDAGPSDPVADAIGPATDASESSADGQGAASDTAPDQDDAATRADIDTPSNPDTSGGADAEDATSTPEQDSMSSEDTSPEPHSDADGPDVQGPTDDVEPPPCQPDCAGA